ncbi:sensor histidine kinase [Bifidobacterium simiiventris]|uniref:sensor histidine kinase n=1 Tax=Bifidobacterium simiiventris TaxID=2834434 RepID=UPI001C559687|nr:HAMP domain-containing histidine kinase [Bifidobacterium simiiventris]
MPNAATPAIVAQARPNWFQRHVRRRIDAVPLSTKLVACIIVLLTIGSFALSFSIRQLVSSYLMEKTDKQLSNQSELVVNAADILAKTDPSQSNFGLNDYYVQLRDLDYKIVRVPLKPTSANGTASIAPLLPDDGSMGSVQLGVPFTTTAVITTETVSGQNSQNSQNGSSDPQNGSNGGTQDDSGSQSAQNSQSAQSQQGQITVTKSNAPWRVLVLPTADKNGTPNGYAFIALPLKDVVDTTNTLTRYSAMVGIAVVLLGAAIGTLLVQTTLTPLKRIEKTAAKIAAGDLSQRVPSAPENTEVGSLAASLNAMLARIEQSFHEQQETTEKMKRFVSDASHELRTPLAAIHGYAELYKMQREFPGALERADESIEHIEASSARMTVLVEDLLSLARLDEGRGIDLTQQVPLTSIVSDATEDLHALDPERGIRSGRLELVPAEDGSGSRFAFTPGDMPQITLSGDGSRLRQVVTNIVGNIHRYTPADSPVEVSMGVLPASISPESLARMPATEASMKHLVEAVEVGQTMHVGMNYAFIRFSDHGPGVPEESRSQIFERFYTADPSRARLKGGTGLGMAIALSVVKAHRGFICASGSEGGGLTLTVVLPIAPVEPQVDAAHGTMAAPAAVMNAAETRQRSAKPDKKTRVR